MILYIILFVASLAVLIVASDWFVDSSEKIGLSLGISPFIIGLTIIAFGTSLPELATSIASVYSDSSEIVVGNVIGSNITNILLVLGLTAVMGREIILDFDIMQVDMPLLFGSSFLLFFCVMDQNLAWYECILMLIGLIVFLLNSVSSKKEEVIHTSKIGIKTYLYLIVGAFFVYMGASYVIVSIEQISSAAGISPEIIALTAVALGTSLPEIVVSLTAAKRGQHAIAVGNVLGSNVFNTFAVMGIPGLMGNLIIPAGILDFSLPFMLAVTILFGMICLSRRISKWEGAMLIVFYLFFIGEMVTRGIV